MIRPSIIAVGVFAVALLGAPRRAHSAVDGPASHTVYPGQTLGKIAKRYNVSIEQLCAANGIRRNAGIKPGQKLLLPDKGGQVAKPAEKRSGSWKDHASPPRRKGYVVLEAPTKRWRGYVLGKSGRVLPQAKLSIERMFASWRTGKRHPIDPRLIQVVVKVSDTFGGRPIRVVSGYRERSFAVESKHRVGRALDFSIPGVPNAALKEYLRTLGPVGVGYYPSSTHVHLDVRERRTYWVDASAPGAAPEYLGRKAKTVEGDVEDADSSGEPRDAEGKDEKGLQASPRFAVLPGDAPTAAAPAKPLSDPSGAGSAADSSAPSE